jgi:hypothetical protein
MPKFCATIPHGISHTQRADMGWGPISSERWTDVSDCDIAHGRAPRTVEGLSAPHHWCGTTRRQCALAWVGVGARHSGTRVLASRRRFQGVDEYCSAQGHLVTTCSHCD